MANIGDLYASGCAKIATTALANSLIVVAGQAVYYGCDGRNTGSITLYYFIFDNTVVPANANPVVPNPFHVIAVPSGANWAHGPYVNGEHYGSGIVIVASSTDYPNLTIDTNTKSFIACDYANEYGMY
jgi:hypothetical protein